MKYVIAVRRQAILDGNINLDDFHYKLFDKFKKEITGRRAIVNYKGTIDELHAELGYSSSLIVIEPEIRHREL